MHKLTDIWQEFTERYEAAPASLRSYHQKYQVFLKWVIKFNSEGRGDKKLKCMEDVTRSVAEDYARWIYKRKSTAKKDIDNLRRIWSIMLPDQRKNPWNIGLHLRAPIPKSPYNYRPLTLEEARDFYMALHLAASKSYPLSPDYDGRYGNNPDKFIDLADAVVFAWHYGMRMGSLVSLRWEDMEHRNEGYFLHIPPKTRFSKPWPLEIPIVAEIKDILERRIKAFDGRPRGWIFPALREAHSRCASNLSSSVKGIFNMAGIRNTYKGRAQIHSFRASFITQMDEAGAPTGITDAITGHATRTIHDMYSHARVGALKKWLDKAIPNIVR